MGKFTKGDWMVCRNLAGAIEVHIGDPFTNRDADWRYLNIGIATDGEDCTNNPTALANAHLIAAAPKMYREIQKDIEKIRFKIKLKTDRDEMRPLLEQELNTKLALLAEARGEK